MAGTALRRRLTWQLANVVDNVTEAVHARRLVLDIDGWDGHLPGQHVDVRLTAADGYSAQRSYSIASSAEGGTVDLIVVRVDDGEVSPYLTDVVMVSDQFELRGPIGGYFVWHAGLGGPLQLIAGGAGVTPFLAMLDHHAASGTDVPVRLLYSVREPAEIIARSRLEQHAARGVRVDITVTRGQPADWDGLTGRVTSAVLADVAWPAELSPQTFVCGPTSFVEAVADLLVGAGHSPHMIKTERFG